MDHGNWQLVPVFFFIAVATCYLLWSVVQFLRGTSTSACSTSGCDGCSSTDMTDSSGNGSRFVSLESLETNSDQSS